MKKGIAFILITGLMTFTCSISTAAQDTSSVKSKKTKVVLKIKSDDNGKITVIDTVYDLMNPRGQYEFEKAMKEYDSQMNKMQEEMKNLEVFVDMPDFSDSVLNDSVIRHFKFDGKKFKYPHYKWDYDPRDFGYDFDYEYKYRIPRPEIRNFRLKEDEQMLSDLLGDIPMDRVKSYVIKDKKNGKRIIIDLYDGPVIEKGHKVLIIRDPAESPGKKGERHIQKKIIIRSGDDREFEIQER